MQAHEAARGLLRERLERQPAREGGDGWLPLEGFLLPGREPIQQELHAHLPLLLLLLDPFVKGSLLAQPEAIEEGPAYQSERVLHLGGQGAALRLRGERGDPPGLLVGLLHHVQVQFEGGMQVQAEQVTFTAQMAVPGKRGFVIAEQAAQQRQGVAQGRTSIVGFAVGPQESS